MDNHETWLDALRNPEFRKRIAHSKDSSLVLRESFNFFIRSAWLGMVDSRFEARELGESA